MKYLYLLLWIALFVIILILYFQMAVFGEYTFPFFWMLIGNQLRVLYIIFFSFVAGVLLTLSIKWFLESNADYDDWFDI